VNELIHADLFIDRSGEGERPEARGAGPPLAWPAPARFQRPLAVVSCAA